MIEEFVTVNDTVERETLNPRAVQTMCAKGKIEGVTRLGNAWAIPSNAKKSVDNRVVTESTGIGEKTSPKIQNDRICPS